MGGEIGLLSRKGWGSTFHFDLPLEAALATGTVPQGTASAVCEKWRLDEPARILVAEDTADNRLLLEHYLRGEPVELRFAADGQEAVEVSRSHDFDLILMDIDMPGLDGYAATKVIRERQAEQGAVPTPIVALSAHAMREAVRASLDAGCVAHIAKPVERSTLLRTIHRYALSKNVRPVGPPATAMADGVASLVPAYLASKPKQIEEARACLAEKDFEPIQRFGHNLKGTGRGYGFPRIEELGKEIESAARARDEDRTAIQLEALCRFVTQERGRAMESQEPAECGRLALQTKPSTGQD
jgi:CheY-like chemotaxis protein